MSENTPEGGGTAEETQPQAETGQQPTEPKPSESAELGDAGKRALAEERDSRKAAEKRAKAAEAELDKLRNASKSEQEKALDAARKEGETAANERWKTRAVAAEVRAAAATLKFHDPRDAVAQLHDSLGDIGVDDDGEVDGKAIEKLLSDLKESKPYLVDEGRKPPPSFNGGPRGSGDNRPEPTPGIGRLRDAYATSSNK